MLKPARWRASCTTSIFCASMVATPTTDRSKPNDSWSSRLQFIQLGTSPSRGHGHYRFLLWIGNRHRAVPEGKGEHRRRLLYGGTGDDRLGGRTEFSFRQSGRTGINGGGRIGLPVRHSGDPLVLERGHSGDAVSRAGDDAFLLHFEDALGA